MGKILQLCFVLFLATSLAKGQVPAKVDSGDVRSVELGMKFFVDVNGSLSRIGFYKSASNLGLHVGHVWSLTGTLLGTATFVNETATGWQWATFPAPVVIKARTAYVASVLMPVGHYSLTENALGSAINVGPLHVPASGTYGPNGVYHYGTSAFPASDGYKSNYFINISFLSAPSLANLWTGTPTTTTTTTTPPVPPPPSTGGYLFKDDFESGNFSKWSTVWTTTDNVVQSSIVHSGTHAARIHYALPASSTGANRDNNRSFSKYFNSGNGYPSGLSHFFVRGYVYHQTPIGTADSKAQRKIFYLKETSNGGWHSVLKSFGMQMAYQSGPPQDGCWVGSDVNNYWNLYSFSYNTWYSVEMEVQLNTPCKHDGVVNLWVNGKQVAHLTGQNIRGNMNDGLQDVEIGDQLDSSVTNSLEEYRYWDDVVISKTYIGP